MLAVVAASINVALNFLLIPQLGMMGAAWSTAISFLFLSAGTAVVSQRFYPVAYEYGRLAKIIAAGVLVYAGGNAVAPATLGLSLMWHLAMPLLAFPGLLMLTGFLDYQERMFLGGLFRRYVPLFE